MGRLMQVVVLTAALVLATAAAQAADRAPAPYKAPRTPDGRPDLQGQWTNVSLTPFERPAAFDGPTTDAARAAAFEQSQPQTFLNATIDQVGGRQSEWWEFGAAMNRIDGQIRTSWVVEPADGKVPYTLAGRQHLTDAQATILSVFDNPEERPTSERCLMAGASAGPPMLAANSNSNYRIVQTRDHVAIQMELNPEVRIIRLNDTRPPTPGVRPWMGVSVGRWEGETLVVETTHLNPAEGVKGTSGVYISPDAKVTERFTRIAADQILYRFTVEDPAAYTRPWRAETILRPARGPMYEYACHEGNYALETILVGARQAPAAVATGD